ncbi:hypothetical protein L9F63_006067, partial [Diploptera punctata]
MSIKTETQVEDPHQFLEVMLQDFEKIPEDNEESLEKRMNFMPTVNRTNEKCDKNSVEVVREKVEDPRQIVEVMIRDCEKKPQEERSNCLPESQEAYKNCEMNSENKKSNDTKKEISNCDKYNESLSECNRCNIIHKPFRCNVCLNNEHTCINKEKFSCSTCNTTYSVHNEFIHHVEGQKNEKTFHCILCNKTFP